MSVQPPLSEFLKLKEEMLSLQSSKDIAPTAEKGALRRGIDKLFELKNRIYDSRETDENEFIDKRMRSGRRVPSEAIGWGIGLAAFAAGCIFFPPLIPVANFFPGTVPIVAAILAGASGLISGLMSHHVLQRININDEEKGVNVVRAHYAPLEKDLDGEIDALRKHKFTDPDLSGYFNARFENSVLQRKLKETQRELGESQATVETVKAQRTMFMNLATVMTALNTINRLR